MFESSLSMAITKWGNETCQKVDHDYYKVWEPLEKHFNPNWKPDEELKENKLAFRTPWPAEKDWAQGGEKKKHDLRKTNIWQPECWFCG